MQLIILHLNVSVHLFLHSICSIIFCADMLQSQLWRIVRLIMITKQFHLDSISIKAMYSISITLNERMVSIDDNDDKVDLPRLEWLPIFLLNGSALPLSCSAVVVSGPLLLVRLY